MLYGTDWCNFAHQFLLHSDSSTQKTVDENILGSSSTCNTQNHSKCIVLTFSTGKTVTKLLISLAGFWAGSIPLSILGHLSQWTNGAGKIPADLLDRFRSETGERFSAKFARKTSAGRAWELWEPLELRGRIDAIDTAGYS